MEPIVDIVMSGYLNQLPHRTRHFVNLEFGTTSRSTCYIMFEIELFSGTQILHDELQISSLRRLGHRVHYVAITCEVIFQFNPM